jgi:integrase/recombinase XerD
MVAAVTVAVNAQDSGAARIVAREPRIVALPRATSAETDEQLLHSWLASLGSSHSRRNFRQTGRRFLAGLQMGMRLATVEHVREAIDRITAEVGDSSARQYVLRVKSLLTYAHELGYTPFNAGVTIKVRSENRGATMTKRIISEVEVGLLIRAAKTKRDRVLIQVAYGGGLRPQEVVDLTGAMVIDRGELLQLSITGKGGKVRQVLLPKPASEALRGILGVTGPEHPVFASRQGGHLSTRSVHAMVKRTARRAGVTGQLSPHWLRHAHGSHALDRGATLAEVQETLGHSNVATTSGYLHARPERSSGLKLDPGVFVTD